MKYVVILVSILVSPYGMAQTVDDCTTNHGVVMVTWTIPDRNTDGSVLTQSEIVGYRIYYGTNSTALNKTNDVSGGGVMTKQVIGLPCGVHFFAMTTRTAGEESARTNIASATLASQQTPPPPDPVPVPTPDPTPPPDPAPTPPPSGLPLVCACQNEDGTSSHWGGSGNYRGCGSVDDEGTVGWRWVSPIATTYVRTDASPDWAQFGSLSNTALVGGAYGQTVGTTTARTCQRLATMMPKSVFLVATVPPPDPVPAPIPVLSVSDVRVYKQSQDINGYTMKEIGTIALKTACNPSHVVDGFNLLPDRTKVLYLCGSNKTPCPPNKLIMPTSAYAKCVLQ